MQFFVMPDIPILILLALSGGGVLALIVTGMMWQAESRRLRHALKHAHQSETVLENQLGLYEAFFNLSQQCLVIWDIDKTSDQSFWMSGTVMPELDIPREREKFFDFTNWLEPQQAQELAQAIRTMKGQTQNFLLSLDYREDGVFHVQGKRIGTQMMLVFEVASQQFHENLQQKRRDDDVHCRLTTLQMLLDEIKHPIWMRDRQANISWGNRAYFREAGEDYELLPDSVIKKINAAHAKDEPFFGRTATIINANRHVLDITAVKGPSGSAGMAMDNTQMVTLREDAERTLNSYLAIFDDLPTAIAIFDAKQKLEFFNQSFVKLWSFDVAFLETGPSHTLLLERLRESQILAENPDWQSWKEQLFEAYRTVEPQLHLWNLPDGRTLRVLANPNPQGGVSWLYEDLTEKLQLEARYNTLIHMQGETLDHLHEGVGLFGPDGRLRLANPAFGHLWGLPPHLVIEGVHISQIEAFCAPLCASPHGEENWQRLVGQITGFSDGREMATVRIERLDGQVSDAMLVPLPQGQTMLSFLDVSDSVKVARALQERNEALESANRLRTDFVNHVSYELRTPLTNIIGFTDMLRRQDFGPMNARQHECLDDIGSQSLELLNLVNDIIDLATVDAGIMQLDMVEVNIAATMRASAARIEERLLSRNISLDMRFDEDISCLHADETRLRQILFNLLVNAANFTPEGSTIGFYASKEGEEVVFRVHDEGSGIPDDILDKVFERFCGQARHGTRPGAGLGLSLVKSFVDLHHGRIEIETGTGDGTTVICRFPLASPLLHEAAE